eukprot:CAMPEP_0113952756 /NCGR_PEP_ID=MMETSP1339-20121228/90599_1 /TAXON_ID=94617 /ORGANISM="Fibrocapsa japonica" /LENGTH=328 /DNA_ID=CAMNT_0000961417 /DNA_START=165 /DNA_END=1151 /DNA_ORIENTATION=- /assembly_acc=CAM_ASM_000762
MSMALVLMRANAFRGAPIRFLRSFPTVFRLKSTSEPEPTTSGEEIVAPPNFTPPEPKKFNARGDIVGDIMASSFVNIMRLGNGVFVEGYSVGLEKDQEEEAAGYTFAKFAGQKTVEKGADMPRPEKNIVIYEFEGCPFCRKLREALCILELDVEFRPCPKDGGKYRPEVVERGGKAQFPYMVDPNTGTEMYESGDIIRYLYKNYGTGENIPFRLSDSPLNVLTAGIGMIPRLGKGSKYTPAKAPSQSLELWGYEGSPFVKIVRETLCELELPHLLHYTPRGGKNRTALMKKTGGVFQVPYLEDPNTGVKMFESAEIVDYIRQTYQLQV